MKRNYTAADIEAIILMAWGDTITFEAIERAYGLSEAELKVFMRMHQTPATYRRWRTRVQGRPGRSSKHERLTTISSRRQKFAV